MLDHKVDHKVFQTNKRKLQSYEALVLTIVLPLIHGDHVRHIGPVCFRFFGCRFSENQDSEIIQLSGKSAVWISRVFVNPDYLVPIL